MNTHKICDRCHFHVPARQALCHVCGSAEFMTAKSENTNSFVAQAKKNIAKLSVPKLSIPKLDMPRLDMPRLDMPKIELPKAQPKPARPYSLSGHKVQMKLQEIEAEAQMEDALHSHECSVQGSQPLRLTTEAEEGAAILEGFKRSLGDLRVAERPSLVGDEVASSPAAALAAQEFGKLITIQTVMSDSADCQVGEAPSTELKENLNSLRNWFEQFGKDGILVKKDDHVVAHEESEESQVAAAGQAA